MLGSLILLFGALVFALVSGFMMFEMYYRHANSNDTALGVVCCLIVFLLLIVFSSAAAIKEKELMSYKQPPVTAPSVSTSNV